jgi:hypothetical protein
MPAIYWILVLKIDPMPFIALLSNLLLYESVAATRMGCKSELAEQMKEDGSHGRSVAAAEYEEPPAPPGSLARATPEATKP